MADDKNGREKQADDAERRQRERDLRTELERRDEPEPEIRAEELTNIEAELEDVAFPATGGDIIAAVGDHKVVSRDETYSVADLLPDTNAETFEAPVAVRARVARPTVASAMKRVVEAGGTLRNAEFGTSQRDAYERTFEELQAIDADDEDEGVRAVADWIVARIHEKGALPGSRAVRRQAAKFCRTNGYAVRNDEWLGI